MYDFFLFTFYDTRNGLHLGQHRLLS